MGERMEKNSSGISIGLIEHHIKQHCEQAGTYSN